MNRLQFIFDLLDNMSGPINTIVGSLDRLLGVTNQVGSSTDRMQNRIGGMTGKISAGFEKVRGRAENFKRSMEGINSGIERMFSLPNIIGATVVGEGIKTVLEAGVQKEQTMTVFDTMLGGDKKQAKQVYNQMINFAGQTPIQTDVVQREWGKLLSDGFQAKLIPTMFSAIGDLSSLRGFSEMSINDITRDFAEIKSMGHLNGRVVTNLTSYWGLSRSKLDEAIAERMHVKPQDVEKLIRKGGVNSTVGISALMAAIQKQLDPGKKLGYHMQAQSQTLGGLWSTLKSRPMEFLGGIADTQGFASLKILVKQLGDAFNPASAKGEKFQQVVVGILGKITDLVTGPLITLTKGDNLINAAQKFANYVQLALNWWTANGPAVVTGVKQFGAGFMNAAHEAQHLYEIAKPALTWIGGMLEKFTGGKKGSMGGPLGTLAFILGNLAFGGLVVKGGGLLIDGGAALIMSLNKLTFGIIPKLFGWSGKVLSLGFRAIGSDFMLEILTNPAGKMAGLKAALSSTFPTFARLGSLLSGGIGGALKGLAASLGGFQVAGLAAFDAVAVAAIAYDGVLLKNIIDQNRLNTQAEAQNQHSLDALSAKGPAGMLEARRIELMSGPQTPESAKQLALINTTLAKYYATQHSSSNALVQTAMDAPRSTWAVSTAQFCSHYVKQCFERVYGGKYDNLFGASAIKTAQRWHNAGLTQKYSGDVNQLKAGDVLFQEHGSGGYGHTGIYIGNGMVSENTTYGTGKGQDARKILPISTFGSFEEFGRLPEAAAKKTPPSTTINVHQTIQAHPNASQKDIDAQAKAARKGAHEGASTALIRHAAHAGAM